MARLPNRKTLESMKRSDIQKLCKDYGVKANLKTEALIDLLLDVNTPPKQDLDTSQPQRRVSTRTSSRAVPSRTSSLIIHDVQEEDGEDRQRDGEEEAPLAKPPALAPQLRTRKAKETQLRLGVGRPKVAGGSGARTVTKSVSLSRGKRGKGSRTVQPSEAPIPEEEEPEPDDRLPLAEPPSPHPASTSPEDTADFPVEIPLLDVPLPWEPPDVPSAPNAPPTDLDKYIAKAVEPLRRELTSLHTELDQTKQQVAQVDGLKDRIEFLTAQVAEFRSQAAEAMAVAQELRDALKTPSNPRTPPPRSPRQEVPRAPLSISATTIAAIAGPSSRKGDPLGDPPSPSRTPHDKSLLPHPGFALTALGKRHRDSTATNATGFIEEDEGYLFSQEELATKVIRPMKKRPKTSSYDGFTPDGPPAGPSRSTSSPPPFQAGSQVPSFTVFQDPDPSDYVDPPPPTNHLPEYFEPPGSSRLPSTSSSHASENQHPFGFSFLPYTSTPANSNLVPPLPYPEAGQSPTPGIISRAGLASHSEGFQPLDQDCASDGAQEIEGSFVDPVALTPPASDRRYGGSGNGPAATISSQTLEGTKPPRDLLKPATMYGTELEGDTRFGDFGVEGVASSQSLPNFWSAGKF